MHVRNISTREQTVTDTRHRVRVVQPDQTVDVPDTLGFALLRRSPPAWRYEPDWRTPAEGTPVVLPDRV